MLKENLTANIRTDEISGEHDTKYGDIPPGGSIFFCSNEGGYPCSKLSNTNGASPVFQNIEDALEQIIIDHPSTQIGEFFQHNIRLIIRPK
jgi:hypothetical protein